MKFVQIALGLVVIGVVFRIVWRWAMTPSFVAKPGRVSDSWLIKWMNNVEARSEPPGRAAKGMPD